MRRSVLLVTGLAVVCLSLLSASDAKGASNVHRFSFGPGAAAFWEFPEADGGFTGVAVFAGDERIHDGAITQSGRFVTMQVFTFSAGADPADPADDTVRIVIGHTELAAGELVLSGRRLDGATLQASIPAEDCIFTGPPSPEPPPPGSCSETTISADLAWTATGPFGSHQSSFHERFPGCIANAHFSFTGRPAEVQGSVTVGDIGGTNYTRGETGFGDLIARSRDQFVSIGDNCFEF
jgi:hypothetical protein